jgi:hypothetical protein
VLCGYLIFLNNWRFWFFFNFKNQRTINVSFFEKKIKIREPSITHILETSKNRHFSFIKEHAKNWQLERWAVLIFQKSWETEGSRLYIPKLIFLMFFSPSPNEVSVLPGLITGGYLELILTLAEDLGGGLITLCTENNK